MKNQYQSGNRLFVGWLESLEESPPDGEGKNQQGFKNNWQVKLFWVVLVKHPKMKFQAIFNDN